MTSGLGLPVFWDPILLPVEAGNLLCRFKFSVPPWIIEPRSLPDLSEYLSARLSIASSSFPEEFPPRPRMGLSG